MPDLHVLDGVAVEAVPPPPEFALHHFGVLATARQLVLAATLTSRRERSIGSMHIDSPSAYGCLTRLQAHFHTVAGTQSSRRERQEY